VVRYSESSTDPKNKKAALKPLCYKVSYQNNKIMKINLYSIFSYQSSIQLAAQSLKQMSPKTVIRKKQNFKIHTV